MGYSNFQLLLNTVLARNKLVLMAFADADQIAILNPTLKQYHRGLEIGQVLGCDTYSPGMWGVAFIDGVEFHWNPMLSVLLVPSLHRLYSLEQVEEALVADSFYKKIMSY